MIELRPTEVTPSTPARDAGFAEGPWIGGMFLSLSLGGVLNFVFGLMGQKAEEGQVRCLLFAL